MTLTPKSPFVVPVPRAARRRASKALNIFVQVAVVASLTLSGGFGLGVQPAQAAVNLNLDQWHNDAAAWANGNININNSSYHEGEAVPFKLVVTGLGNGNSQVVRIRYDATKASINAYDYLVDYNFSESPSPVPGGSPVTATIPADSGLGFTQDAGSFSLWGGTFGTISGPTTDVNEKYYDVELIGSGSNLTLLWAGHLASETDWGTGNGSSSISGAPFHQAASEINGQSETGKQDRSIQPGSILSPNAGTLRVTKVVNGGTALPENFGFRIAGTNDAYVYPASGDDFVVFTDLTPDTYSIQETGPNGYTATGNTCVDVVVAADQLATCTVTNTRDMGTVTITKQLQNEENGSAVPSDWTFTLHANQQGLTDVSGIQSGVPVQVPTGFYTVTESGPSQYSFLGVDYWVGDCNPDGDIYLEVTTEGATCTFYNETYAIHGQKFDDKDANGVWDQGEPALNGWTVFIDANGNGAFDNGESSLVTQPHDDGIPGNDDNGWYWFKDLAAGTYDVCEVPQNGWNQTYPQNANHNCHTVVAGQSFQIDRIDVSTCASQETLNAVFAPSCNFGNHLVPVTTLGLTKTASPTTTNPLTVVTYTVTWSVSGNSLATGVVLTDPVPTNVNFVSAANGGVYDANTKIITWNLGTKNPGDSGSVTWVGQVAQTAPAGTIVNTASIDSNETDPVITATANIVVTIPQVLGSTAPDLTIEKSVDSAIANPGDTVQYTVLISNVGDGDATDVVVTDTLPAGFTYEMGGESTMTWNLGTIKVGASRTLTYTVVVGTDVKAGTYTNTATVTANDLEPRSDTADVTVKEPQVLGVATTGASALDYFLLALGGLLVAFGAFSLVRQRRAGTNA